MMFAFRMFIMKSPKPFAGALLPLIICKITFYSSDVIEDCYVGEHVVF